MTVKLVEGDPEWRSAPDKRYRSPQEIVRTDPAARKTLESFMQRYVASSAHHGDKVLPLLERETEAGEARVFEHEMFTGYGGLGELVHIRVDPLRAHETEGYFVGRGNLFNGEIDDVKVRLVERFHECGIGQQMIIYLDDERCPEWPIEYQPMIHAALGSFRFTYRPGFGQGGSLLLPIETFVGTSEAAVIPTHRSGAASLGRRALELVHSTSKVR